MAIKPNRVRKSDPFSKVKFKRHGCGKDGEDCKCCGSCNTCDCCKTGRCNRTTDDSCCMGDKCRKDGCHCCDKGTRVGTTSRRH